MTSSQKRRLSRAEVNKEFFNIKKLKTKLDFTNREIIKSSYFIKCSNENLKEKNSIFQVANNYIHKATDYLQMIKLKKEFV